MKFLNINLKKTSDHMLVFQKWPWTQWFVGLVVFIFGSTMMYYLLVGHFHKEGFLFLHYDPKRNQHFRWWHYVTAIGIMLLGVLFVCSGKVRILEFNKISNYIRKVKISVFCKRQEEVFDLHMVKGVKGFRRGHKGLT